MSSPALTILDALKDAPLGPDGYHNFVFRFDLEHYRKRIKMVKFEGAGKVLDVGCGMGQWANELAALNDYVVAVDRMPYMLECSRILFEAYGTKNVKVQFGELPQLDFPDEEFDMIWCWSVFMFVDRQATMREFNRLLKPGGKFLVGATNSRGRWLYKTLTCFNFLNKWHARRSRLKRCWNTFMHGSKLDAKPNYTTIHSCADLCDCFGFKLIAADYDGHIDLTGQGQKRIMFKPRFMFMENNIEFIGQKVRSLK